MPISDTLTNLKEAYNDWSAYLINPRYIRNGNLITWNNYESCILKDPVLTSTINDLADKRQYTFQTLDGSIIQIYYKFDPRGSDLLEARLAFFSAVSYNSYFDAEQLLQEDEDLSSFQTTEEIYSSSEFDGVTESQPLNSSTKVEPASWIRIDYAPHDQKGLLHHSCHLNTSAFPYTRLVVAGIPTPRQFIEFIMLLTNPNDYQFHRLQQDGTFKSEIKIKEVNSNCFQLTDHPIFNQISHFRIPDGSLLVASTNMPQISNSRKGKGK